MVESQWKFHRNSCIFHQNLDRIFIWFLLEFHWKPEPFGQGSRGISSGKLECMETCQFSTRNALEPQWFSTGIPVVSSGIPGISTGIWDNFWTLCYQSYGQLKHLGKTHKLIFLCKASFGHFFLTPPPPPPPPPKRPPTKIDFLKKPTK